jgi:hypothetical protein
LGHIKAIHTVHSCCTAMYSLLWYVVFTWRGFMRANWEALLILCALAPGLQAYAQNSAGFLIQKSSQTTQWSLNSPIVFPFAQDSLNGVLSVKAHLPVSTNDYFKTSLQSFGTTPYLGSNSSSSQFFDFSFRADIPVYQGMAIVHYTPVVNLSFASHTQQAQWNLDTAQSASFFSAQGDYQSTSFFSAHLSQTGLGYVLQGNSGLKMFFGLLRMHFQLQGQGSYSGQLLMQRTDTLGALITTAYRHITPDDFNGSVQTYGSGSAWIPEIGLQYGWFKYYGRAAATIALPGHYSMQSRTPNVLDSFSLQPPPADSLVLSAGNPFLFSDEITSNTYSSEHSSHKGQSLFLTIPQYHRIQIVPSVFIKMEYTYSHGSWSLQGGQAIDSVALDARSSLYFSFQNNHTASLFFMYPNLLEIQLGGSVLNTRQSANSWPIAGWVAQTPFVWDDQLATVPILAISTALGTRIATHLRWQILPFAAITVGLQYAW